MDECTTCGGTGWVRRKVDGGGFAAHALQRCPDCPDEREDDPELLAELGLTEADRAPIDLRDGLDAAPDPEQPPTR